MASVVQMTIKIFAFLLTVSACSGQQAGTANNQPPARTIHQLYVEDQADREAPGGDLTKLDWGKMAQRDDARRKQVRAMLETGELKSGADFREASFIFQHGFQADDYLLAHILAMAAVAKGDQESRWIAAATLDRYLHNIGQKQVFGTQYHSVNNEPMTQEPFNRALVPAPLRETLCVPNDHLQQVMLEAFRQNRDPDLSKFESEQPCRK
jgi:hypothetical protein